MNGRIYDPKLGRMLQADLFVQAPKNSQSLNRYTYVYNNPLSYTDPSGLFSLKRFWNKIRPFAAIGLVGWAPWGTGLWATIATGAEAGYIATGTILGAVAGAFSGAAFYGIGSSFSGLAGTGRWGELGLSGEAFLGKSILHGAVGGILALNTGGRFGHGFAAAGFTQLLSGRIGTIDGGNVGFSVQRTIAAAIAGGTVSQATGGKFANGALTGAFSRAFNDEAHPDQSITDEQLSLATKGEYEAFWKSRWSVNRDPVARTALQGINGETASARYAWGRLRSYISDNGLSVSMDQISRELALAHAQAMFGDTEGIRGLLSPGQVANYHHQIFGQHNIPPSMFGGTMGVPGVRVPVPSGWAQPTFSPNSYSRFWCNGCDSVP